MSTPRRTADALDLGAGNADVLMLYQAIAETRACGGAVALDFPHPDTPLRFTFEFTARRPVLRDGVTYAAAGEPLSVELKFSLARAGAAPPEGRATFYDIGDARDRLSGITGLDEALIERILARLGWPQ